MYILQFVSVGTWPEILHELLWAHVKGFCNFSFFIKFPTRFKNFTFDILLEAK